MAEPRKRRPPRLPLPQGIDNYADFGRLIGWGRGNAEALARSATVTRGEMVRGRMTAEIAQAWRDMYEAETKENPRNPSSSGRTVLMARIIELLGD